MTEHLRTCGESEGFATAPEADHEGDPGHADRDTSDALCLGTAAELSAARASAQNQTPTRAQASGHEV